MIKFIGKKQKLTASIGAYDHKLRKLCLLDVTSEDGFHKDHMWVNYTKRLSFNPKTKIKFTAMVTEYLGLDGDKQVKKVGLTNVRSVSSYGKQKGW